MTILKQLAGDVQANPSATNKNSTSAESASKSSSSDRGGKEKEQWRRFSKTLAIEINPKQPDITSALLFEHVAFRMKHAPRYAWKNDRPWHFHSLRDLQKDIEVLTEDQIFRAINVLEEKGKLVVKRGDKDYGPTYWLSCNRKAKLAHDKSSFISFCKADALRYGIKEAILLGNLQWQMDHWENFVTDDAGNKYGKLSPSRLARKEASADGIPTLPFSRRTIIDALKALCEEHHALVLHPSRASHYAFRQSFKVVQVEPKPEKCPVQESNNTVQESNSIVQESNSAFDENARRASNHQGFLASDERVNSNIIINEHSKGKYLKQIVSAALQLSAPNTNSLSDAGTRLLDTINDGLTKFRNRHESGGSPALRQVERVPSDLLPHDDFTGVDLDLPYDNYTGVTYELPYDYERYGEFKSQHEWVQQIDQWVKEIVAGWKERGVQYRKLDRNSLRQLFMDNPSFQLEHWYPIQGSVQFLLKDKSKRGQHCGLTGEFYRDSAPSHGVWDNTSIQRRITSPAKLFQYLPRVIHQMFISSKYFPDDRPEWSFVNHEGEIPEPYASLDYSYMKNMPHANLAQFAVERLVTDVLVNPIAA